ncbi:hypothetical protein NE237_009632 [Protea cynaroides]|uniref:Uncharacterized protein n=1 Tax=Protea cynaroides TaxID=273540 RepID=A0A9Q0R0U1_9MAGN|nr:hypothetical protein NE237_009632 [Protea cynaroides]
MNSYRLKWEKRRWRLTASRRKTERKENGKMGVRKGLRPRGPQRIDSQSQKWQPLLPWPETYCLARWRCFVFNLCDSSWDYVPTEINLVRNGRASVVDGIVYYCDYLGKSGVSARV